jgi:hypothetical protein
MIGPRGCHSRFQCLLFLRRNHDPSPSHSTCSNNLGQQHMHSIIKSHDMKQELQSNQNGVCSMYTVYSKIQQRAGALSD